LEYGTHYLEQFHIPHKRKLVQSRMKNAPQAKIGVLPHANWKMIRISSDFFKKNVKLDVKCDFCAIKPLVRYVRSESWDFTH
jgi:hypothetical protein